MRVPKNEAKHHSCSKVVFKLEMPLNLSLEELVDHFEISNEDIPYLQIVNWIYDILESRHNFPVLGFGVFWHMHHLIGVVSLRYEDLHLPLLH